MESLDVVLETPRGGRLCYQIRRTTDENIRVVFDGAASGQDFEPRSVRTFCIRILEYMDKHKL